MMPAQANPNTAARSCHGTALLLMAAVLAACAGAEPEQLDSQAVADGSGVAGAMASREPVGASSAPAGSTGVAGGGAAASGIAPARNGAAGSGIADARSGVGAAGSGDAAAQSSTNMSARAGAGSGANASSAGAGNPNQEAPRAAGMSAAGSAGALAAAGGAPAAGAGAAASGEVTIWLAGDSTVAKGNTPCPVGWGASFQALFKPEAKVVNSAVGGRSVRTWLYEVQTQMDSSGECALNRDSAGEPVLQMRWQAMLDGMKAGDYLFIQFGINDSSRTCDRHVGLEAFKESYGMMAEAAKMRGAQAVYVTPVSAIACEGSTAKPTRGGFVTATSEAGDTYDVPVIDLHERSIALYNEQGLCPIPGGSDVSASTGGKTGAFFCDDHTHFSAEGAEQVAELMAQALKDQNLGLAAYLK